MIVFSGLIIYLTLGLFVFYLPFQNDLGEEIKRTQKLIDIIPIEIQERYMPSYNNDD